MRTARAHLQKFGGLIFILVFILNQLLFILSLSFYHRLFMTEKSAKGPGTKFTSRIKLCSRVASNIPRSFYSCRCCLDAANKGMGNSLFTKQQQQIIHRSNIPHSLSLFAANNNCCSHSAGFFLKLLLQWLFVGFVILYLQGHWLVHPLAARTA